MASEKIKCVFVHGWGMNKAIWQPVIEQLPDWIEPQAIDLPGHGEASAARFTVLDDLVATLAAHVDQPALWVGWSMGGLAVTQLALEHPEKVSALMLVSSSPCFVQKADWPCGMKAEVFDSFAAELEADFSGTIRRFLALQVQGSDSGRDILRGIRQKILAQPAANPDALRAGLGLLKTVDLRADLAALTLPVSWQLGQRDALVKVALADELARLMPASEINIYKRAAHAPFLSHLTQFVDELTRFAKTLCPQK
ncbi:MAG: pimeloyl-ACP methyl ester esterase BioH [Gammaproteobacteria bacterium]|nr:pimeloyl-ACP methyl ester esterase BioH [Gammaproteobacteria bacterium]